jgi:glycosyltransferase involved in cell wall biosynthesis
MNVEQRAATSGKSVSIVICTRDRAEFLEQTLKAFGRVEVPAGWDVELLIVDNGSTDGTPAVVQSSRLTNLDIRYVCESKRGQSNARNAGLAKARGSVILFTDDDVAPAPDWLQRMALPLLEGACDAAVGRINLAAHLDRPWMEPQHRLWLAAPERAGDGRLELIGASMGFHRSVLDRVPGFDPELGPGALGFGDDTLFSMQVNHAGFRIREVPEALVVHYPDPARLRRCDWLEAARKRGRTQAYLHHHWLHVKACRLPRLKSIMFKMKLRLRRLLQPQGPLEKEGCALWEISYVGNIEMCKQFLYESGRPRNYSKQGLARL